jgi:hypothetical protein
MDIELIGDEIEEMATLWEDLIIEHDHEITRAKAVLTKLSDEDFDAIKHFLAEDILI